MNNKTQSGFRGANMRGCHKIFRNLEEAGIEYFINVPLCFEIRDSAVLSRCKSRILSLWFIYPGDLA